MKNKFVRAITAFVLVLVFIFCLWVGYVSTKYTVPILMYHYINEQEVKRSRLGVSPWAFERQMRFLREHKYNVISLDALSDLMRLKKKIPPNTVVVTFDDGYLDNYTNAFPILKKYNIPATIFVVINRVGKRVGNDDYMNWREIKELSDSGLITIGSHSMSHPNLSENISIDDFKKEIFDSKQILENALNKKVTLFSYPFGGVSLKARAYVIRAGYKAAVGTNFPFGYPDNDVFSLKRLRISENCGNLLIFWVETSGRYTYIKERRDSY